MERLLSIDKTSDKTIRYAFFDGIKCIILTQDKIIHYDIIKKTSTIYNTAKSYNDICYCSKLNCYYAIITKENIIYKLDPDFKIIFSILVNDLDIPLKDIYYDNHNESTIITDHKGVVEILTNKIIRINNDERIISCISNNNITYYLINDDSDFYLIIDNIKYKLPAEYKYNSIVYCDTLQNSDILNVVLSAEDEASSVLLSLNTNELSYDNYNLLYSLAQDEKKIAEDLYKQALNATNIIDNSSSIYDLLNLNKNMQMIIDDVIIDEFLLYKKTYNIINGT